MVFIYVLLMVLVCNYWLLMSSVAANAAGSNDINSDFGFGWLDPSPIDYCADVDKTQARGFSPPGDWCGGGERQWCCVPNTCLDNTLMVQVS